MDKVRKIEFGALLLMCLAVGIVLIILDILKVPWYIFVISALLFVILITFSIKPVFSLIRRHFK